MRGNTEKYLIFLILTYLILIYLILTVNVNVRMQVENSFSKRKDCEKWLKIAFKFTGEDHVKSICKKIHSKLWLIGMVIVYVGFEKRKFLVHFHLKTSFNYCSIIKWSYEKRPQVIRLFYREIREKDTQSRIAIEMFRVPYFSRNGVWKFFHVTCHVVIFLFSYNLWEWNRIEIPSIRTICRRYYIFPDNSFIIWSVPRNI